ncbi:hypothetical protein PRZ48_010721 [Zasmidium cellare]|uniref:Uncharacterized protein n=1 Tax=Zasmidium cellare TaxID=395010 RepID=A0ABR0E9F3_ZASCE|nr:hypothetical protein PRZ48_010721 [Zasmidium cellare]
MFNPRDIESLMREKEEQDASRSQPLRGYSHRRAPPSRTHSDGFFTNTTARGSMFGSGRYPNGLDSYDGFGGGDFPEPSWRAMSPSVGRAERSGAYHRVTFEQAVADMVDALEYAKKGLQSLETTFNRDIAPLKVWLSTQHVDSLWILYTAWNGVSQNPPTSKADGSKNPTTTTYPEIMHRISKALVGLRQSSTPDCFSDLNANSGLSWHVLRTTMRKLEISFEAIEELVGLVRVQRERLAALRHEVGAAGELLGGLRGVVKEGKKVEEEDFYWGAI